MPATCITTAATRSSMPTTSSTIGRTARPRVTGSIPTVQTLADLCPRARSSSSFTRWRPRLRNEQAAYCRGPCQRTPNGGVTSRRRWTAPGASSSFAIRRPGSRSRETSSPPTGSIAMVRHCSIYFRRRPFSIEASRSATTTIRRRKSRKTRGGTRSREWTGGRRRTIASTSPSRTGSPISEVSAAREV